MIIIVLLKYNLKIKIISKKQTDKTKNRVNFKFKTDSNEYNKHYIIIRNCTHNILFFVISI